MARTGVLLTAFGGPESAEAVEPFMCSIMGRRPSPEAVADACERYGAIGGGSPLPAMARRIADTLEGDLSGDVEVPVAVGMLHSHPTIASAVAGMVDVGVTRIVSLSLSPFEAESTTGSYRRALAEAAAAHPGVTVVEAPAYVRGDEFVSALAERARVALSDAGGAERDTLVAFTAHSLPVADIQSNPSYVDQLRETAEAVAIAIGLDAADRFAALPGVDAFGSHSGASPWLLAFQSKGRRGGEWLGPDLDALIEPAVAAGFRSLVVLPIGFALDHMETLFDLDVNTASRAKAADIAFTRALAPNDSEKLVDALASSVRASL